MERPINKKEVGKRIRKMRDALGLTQQQLGDLVGGSPFTTIARWEGGHSLPTRKMAQLCVALNTTMEQLLYAERPRPREGDVRTEEILRILNGPAGELMHPHERDALAIALRDAPADADEVAAFARLLYGRRRTHKARAKAGARDER